MERDGEADLSKGKGEKKGIYLETLINTIKNIGISFSIWEKKTADVSQKGKNFIYLFCSLADKRIKYGNDRVTPYIHTLPYHVPLVIRKCSTMKQLTGQGVEKK